MAVFTDPTGKLPAGPLNVWLEEKNLQAIAEGKVAGSNHQHLDEVLRMRSSG